MRHTLLLLPLLAAPPTLAAPQEVVRRPLRVEDGDGWRSIGGRQLSERGAWVAYQLEPADGGDGTLHVAATDGGRRHVVERGRSARIDFDEGWAACLVAPAREALEAFRAAKKEQGPRKGEAPREPKQGLALVDLSDGARVDLERVQSFRMPDEAGGWIAYLLMEPEKSPEKKPAAEGQAAPEASKQAAQASPPPEEGQPVHEKAGTELVLRHLASGDQTCYEHVVEYTFSKDGRFLAFASATKDGAGDGVFAVVLADRSRHALLEGPGEYKDLAFDETSTQLAFLTDRDDRDGGQAPEKREPRWSLYRYREGVHGAQLVAGAGTAGIPADWGVSPHRAPAFSESGGRLLFGTAPFSEPEPEEPDEDERVVLDVWSWTDDEIQPLQLRQRERELRRAYLTVAHLEESGPRVVRLADPEVPDVQLGDEGDGAWALGQSDRPYRAMRQWDPDGFYDVWRVDAATGERTLLARRLRARPRLSPAGRWAYWWDGEQRHWHTMDLAEAEPAPRCPGLAIPHPLQDELHDQPSLPRAHGVAGWLPEDAALLVYDRFDLWRLDPSGAHAPQCVTDGLGRREGLRLRRVDLDPEEPAVPANEVLLLAAFHERTKRAGFWRDRLAGGAEPTALIMGDERFGAPAKARSGDVLLLTRESFTAYPDLWVADPDLSALRRVSRANPQQGDFHWGTAELWEWAAADGTPLQGVLYRPDPRVAPGGPLPLVVYFYERNSDNLHRHNDPVPSRSTIRFSYYTSNGYCVFVPDIPYRIGYPGQSCLDAVVPGVRSLVEAGVADPARVGVQGHSWGGYQIAYLVTRTDLFAAAVAGAPVSNMTSAYGGIRYQSGMSRQFQYEKTQSRLGGSLWEVPELYRENSPVFFADQVETPLLMLHNDQDGAVPWTQGIEYFVALKRLDKPVWLLNYNGEGHGIGRYPHRRDYAVRLSQFFDHYLRGAPPAVWMVEGVPAVEKGRTLGLDLLEPAAQD